MSIKMMKMVWDYKLPESIPTKQHSTVKLVLLKLADNSDDNGKSFPSMDRIAHECSIARRTVIRATEALEHASVIHTQRRSNNGLKINSVYWLNVPLLNAGAYPYNSPNHENENPWFKNEKSVSADVTIRHSDVTISPKNMTYGHINHQEPSIKDHKKINEPLHGSHVKNGYCDEFEWLWKNKPNREGGNPKKQAYSACKARLKEGSTWRDMAEGLKRYKKYCEAKGLLNTALVQQMSTFFGTKESFKESWSYNDETNQSNGRAHGNANSSRKLSAAEENEARLRKLYGNNSVEGNGSASCGFHSPGDAGHVQQPLEAHGATIELDSSDWRSFD